MERQKLASSGPSYPTAGWGVEPPQPSFLEPTLCQIPSPSLPGVVSPHRHAASSGCVCPFYRGANRGSAGRHELAPGRRAGAGLSAGGRMGSLGALIGCPRGLLVSPGTEPLDHGCLFKFKIVAMERCRTCGSRIAAGARGPSLAELRRGTRPSAPRGAGGSRPRARPFLMRPALTATADQNPQSPGRCFPTNTFTGRGD